MPPYILKVLEGTDQEMQSFADLAVETFYAEPSTVAYAEVWWGPAGPASLQLALDRFVEDAKTDITQRWVAAFDAETGEMAGACMYNIYPRFQHSVLHEWDFEPDYYEGDIRKQAEYAFIWLPKNKNDAVLKKTDGKGEAHIRLSMLFVSSKHRGFGLGRRLIEWGNRIADAMQVPVWVEASQRGKPVYEKCGFVEEGKSIVNTEKWKIEQSLMRRPAVTAEIV